MHTRRQKYALFCSLYHLLPYPASRVALIFLDTSGLLPMMYVNSQLSGNRWTVLLPEFLRSIRGQSLSIRSKGFFNCLFFFSTNIFRSVKRVHLKPLKGCNVLLFIGIWKAHHLPIEGVCSVYKRDTSLSTHLVFISMKSRQDGGRKQPFDLCYTFGCHTFPGALLLNSSDWLRAIMIISSCNQLLLPTTFILVGKLLNQTLLIGFRFLDAHLSFVLPATSQALMDS